MWQKITVLTLLCLFIMADSASPDIGAGITAGYDDNAPLSPESAGSGFIAYQGRFAHLLFTEHPSLDADIFLSGTYYDYLRTGDRSRLEAGASVRTSLSGGRIIPGIFSEYLIYRDDLKKDDEMDEITLGGECELLLSGRLTLNIRGSWSRTDYRNPIRFEPLPVTAYQKDDRYTAGLQGIVYLTPWLQGDITAEYRRYHSSIVGGSYHQPGLTFSLIGMPNESYEISANFSWSRADYDDYNIYDAPLIPPSPNPDRPGPPYPRAYSRQGQGNQGQGQGNQGQGQGNQGQGQGNQRQGFDRTDTTYQAWLKISCFISRFEFFFQTEWLENRSSLETETYRRTVTQCGVIISF